MKIVPVGDDKTWLERHLREVHILERLRNPNIIEYKHTWIESHKPSKFGPEVPCLFILMEFANGGNLEDYMNLECIDIEGNSIGQKRGKSKTEKFLLDETTILRVFLAATKGLQHLHSLGILHRDLKPANLLLKYPHDSVTSPTILLSDFGECAELGQGKTIRTGATGTIEFMAPELFITDGQGSYTHPHSAVTDIWSLGMILFYLYFGHLPYKNIEDVEALEDEMTSLLQIEIPEESSNLSSPMRQLLAHMLNLDWNKRPKLKEIIKAVEAMLMISTSPQMKNFQSPALKAIAMQPIAKKNQMEMADWISWPRWACNFVSGLSLLYMTTGCYPRMFSLPVIFITGLCMVAASMGTPTIRMSSSCILLAMAISSRSFNMCA